MVITTTANTAFDKIFLDLVGSLDRDNNNHSYILTIQCELTKYVGAYSLITKSSNEGSKSFLDNFILVYDILNCTGTVRGTEFLSAVIAEVFFF